MQTPAGVASFSVDLTDPASLFQSGALEGVDYLFHVGGVTKALSLEAFREGNVAPLQALLDAVEKSAPDLRRLTLVSSQAAAGPARQADRPVEEADMPAPFEPYGKSKLEAEHLLLSQRDRIPFTIVRPSAVYGPRDVDFLALFKQLRRGAGLYPANRNARLATIFVEDLVEGLLDATFAEAGRNEVFFLTHEENIAWPEVYQAIAEALGVPLRFEWEIPAPFVRLAGRLGDLRARLTGQVSLINSEKVALGLAPYWTCKAEKARRLIGFSPRTPLTQGLIHTAQWYRNAGWL